jgi:ArsR family transcriptional regulator
MLLAERRIAIDAGTGDGALLDLLAPIYSRVFALDRSAARIEQARARVTARGYDNVQLMC